MGSGMGSGTGSPKLVRIRIFTVRVGPSSGPFSISVFQLSDVIASFSEVNVKTVCDMGTEYLFRILFYNVCRFNSIRRESCIRICCTR